MNAARMSNSPPFGPSKPLLLALLAFAAIMACVAEAFGATARVTVSSDKGSAAVEMRAEPGEAAYGALQVDPEHGGPILAVAQLWAHDGWAEVELSNSSIAASPGAWTGAYEVEVDGVKATRAGAVFHRGTGYLEVFGEPRVRLTLKGIDALQGFFPKTNSAAASAWASKLAPGYSPSAWPIPEVEWAPDGGTAKLADITPNAHQTGSPRNAGCLPPEVCALWIAMGDDAAARRIGGFLWAWAMNQARRPLTWLHPATGEPFAAAEYPKLVIGDYGPSKAWGATETFGDAFGSNKSTWTGLELEHAEVDRLAALAALYDSGFARQQLTCFAEGLLTQPYLRPPASAPVDPGSTRALFWDAKALCWQVALSRDLDRRVAAFQGLSKLAATYLAQSRATPVPYFRRYSPTWATPPAKPKHVAPGLEELRQWAEAFGLEFPEGETNPWLAAQALDDQRDGELERIQDAWSFELVWQVAIGGPVAAFVQRTTGDPRWTAIRRHVAWTLTYARNPSGTFWQEQVPALPFRHGDKDDGAGRDGLAFWTAGGLAACAPLAAGPAREKLIADVASVAAGNKYAQVGNSYGIAFAWFLEGAKDPEIAAMIGWAP